MSCQHVEFMSISLVIHRQHANMLFKKNKRKQASPSTTFAADRWEPEATFDEHIIYT